MQQKSFIIFCPIMAMVVGHLQSMRSFPAVMFDASAHMAYNPEKIGELVGSTRKSMGATQKNLAPIEPPNPTPEPEPEEPDADR